VFKITRLIEARRKQTERSTKAKCATTKNRKNKSHIAKAKKTTHWQAKEKRPKKVERMQGKKKQEGPKKNTKNLKHRPGRNKNEQCRWGTFQVVSNA
jgi:hypothetical protein